MASSSGAIAIAIAAACSSSTACSSSSPSPSPSPLLDLRSGFCASTGVYRSLRPPVPLPSDPFLTLPSFLLLHRPAFDPAAIAFLDTSAGASLSYGLLRSRVHRLAFVLSRRLLLRPGDVVLVLSPNTIDFPVLTLAVMAAGGVVTTTNPLNHPSEIATQAADSQARFVATMPSLLHKLVSLPTQNLPLILLRESFSDPSSESASPSSSSSSAPVSIASFARTVSFSDIIHEQSPDLADDCFPFHRGRQDDTAALLYSSGTTGASKGVILSHRNFIAQISLLLPEQVAEGSPPWNACVFMCLIPMFHVYGMAFFGCGLMARGATTVLQRKFDLIEILGAVQKYRITHLPVVPPVLIALAKLPIVKNFDLSSLVRVGSGAAPLSKEVIEAFHGRFPNVSIGQGYGLTESTAVGANTATDEETRRLGSAGRIAPNTEFKIIDIDSGNPLPPNHSGEIWMRGPTIMKGYFGRPSETAATIDKDGWLHTGDVGFIDIDGYLFIIDRLKELIKYKGLQVAPAELEAVLLSNPEILDAAVIPYPDEDAGQIPMAFVVRDPKCTLSESEVMKFVAEQVAPYKKVRKVAFIPSIPKSISGKVLRRELINIATSRL